jgi:hypothetical protein
MSSVTLEIPETIVTQLRIPPKRMKQTLLAELVLRLYDQGMMTAAQGAALLKMKRLTFERFLAEHEIPIHGEPEEVLSDVANLDQAL